MSKRAKEAPVWKFFETDPDEVRIAICKLCITKKIPRAGEGHTQKKSFHEWYEQPHGNPSPRKMAGHSEEPETDS